MAGVLSKGDSKSWSDGKANVLRIFNLFRVKDGIEEAFAAMPEAQLIRHGLWERFAEFMLNEYEVEDGKTPLRHDEPKRLACSVVINYLRIMLNLVADKWKAIGSNAAKLFCTCLDPHATTEAAKWLGGIKKKIIRICFERDKINGELTDKSETPIYLPEVKKMVAGLAKASHPEAACRAMAISTTWHAGGRSCEAAWVTIDGMEWDTQFWAVCVSCPQPKTSKIKLIM